MEPVLAWVLDLGRERVGAVGGGEMVHLLTEKPRTFEIPRSPPYARHVFIWQDRIVPLIDILHRIEGDPMDGHAGTVGIVRYHPGPDEPAQLGGVRLAGVPRRTRVTDEQACALPAEAEPWRAFVVSCFEHDGGPVPVLDLPRVFAAPAGTVDSE
ncbi:MAG: hypothetical protein GWN84_26445 [Gammaproteobacteria bacterium]|nr:hypothetical protein [Gammaproteobacteria bacterium]NIR85939.1 hypothetical protein [Gammaproteobacteria bacterium]NIR91931.1 hypothetical protein [Gammaproteobacteria bacterium]NIU07188.1 hypothetical protein [Gammaproteobacteria bacterium]NIV54001.1 hypothetical protein [Gammaproteobacteria bacterium]